MAIMRRRTHPSARFPHASLLARALLVLLSLIPLFPLLAAPVWAETATTSELYDYDRLTLKLHLANTLSIVERGPNYRVEEVTADLSWFPRETYRQHVESIVTQPTAKTSPGSLRYVWRTPQTNVLTLQADALIRTSSEPLPVTAVVPYPITSLPSDIALYTEPGELIDTNDDIRRKAMELAATKRDLFEAVYVVADWVTTNIAYNLTTLTADATKPSSWVMANRQGVCDEMTALFISMLRTLGIPARFVSGVSYTNLPEFAEPWGGHGWAEVWFPGTGWVPFDVTYGTYGHIDATHIKLKDAHDAGASSVDFTMRAADASLVTHDLDIGVEILDRQRDARNLFSVTLEPFDDEIGLDSHNLITATVKNEARQYVSVRLSLARTESLELIGGPDRNLLLKPGETTKVRYLVRTTGLRTGYRYSFPIKLYAGFREVGATSFSARQGMNEFPRSFFDSFLNVDGVERSYNDQVTLSCDAEPRAVITGESVDATCELRNLGGERLVNVDGCIEDGCERFSVEPGATGRFSASLACDSPGMKTRLAAAKSRQISVPALVRYECVDEARVEIEALTHPDALGFNEQGEISFRLIRTSDSLPAALTITVRHDNFVQTWEAERLSEPQQYGYTILGQHLDLGENPVEVIVTYTDRLGRASEERRSFTIAPSSFTFVQKMQIHLENLGRWFEAALG